MKLRLHSVIEGSHVRDQRGAQMMFPVLLQECIAVVANQQRRKQIERQLVRKRFYLFRVQFQHGNRIDHIIGGANALDQRMNDLIRILRLLKRTHHFSEIRVRHAFGKIADDFHPHIGNGGDHEAFFDRA